MSKRPRNPSTLPADGSASESIPTSATGSWTRVVAENIHEAQPGIWKVRYKRLAHRSHHTAPWTWMPGEFSSRDEAAAAWAKLKPRLEHSQTPRAGGRRPLKLNCCACAALTRQRCFVFSRKARSYKRAYRSLADGEGHVESDGSASFKEIERLSKLCKTHRCALDQERRFILAS